MCVTVSKEGPGVHDTLMSDALYSIGLTETTAWVRVRLQKKP
jgi:hypothetical protein